MSTYKLIGGIALLFFCVSRFIFALFAHFPTPIPVIPNLRPTSVALIPSWFTARKLMTALTLLILSFLFDDFNSVISKKASAMTRWIRSSRLILCVSFLFGQDLQDFVVFLFPEEREKENPLSAERAIVIDYS